MGPYWVRAHYKRARDNTLGNFQFTDAVAQRNLFSGITLIASKRDWLHEKR